MKTLLELSSENGIFIAAHRGASAVAPEGTITAFSEAIRVGADMIEIDIQFTKDDKIIAYHDDNIDLFDNTDRVDGDFYENNLKISDVNFSDIKHFDVGKKINKNFASEKIPLLEDVFELIKNKTYATIEIKPKFSGKNESNLFFLYKLIKKYNLLEYVVLASFDIENIKYLKNLDKDLLVAVIHNPQIANLPSEYKLKTNCEAFICDINDLDEKINEDARNNNIFLGVYGVNDKATLKKAIDYKVVVIGTDDPEKIIFLHKELQESQTFV